MGNKSVTLQEVSPVWLLMDEISAQFDHFEDDDYYFIFYLFLLTHHGK